MKRKDILLGVFIVLIALIIVVPLAIKVWLGAIPLWYDPARDMLSAWDNLSKPTLIGPPSGIPGIFYGPYWIWILSFAELISHDPRFVVFSVLTIPYLLLFPIVLFGFSKVFSKKIAFLLWVLFIVGYSIYTFYLWNPHPAPFIFLLFIFLLLKSELESRNIKSRFILLISGFCLGILVNFHLSFGIGVVFGTVIYGIAQTVLGIKKNKKKTIQFFKNRVAQMLIFVLGFFITFLPFLLFEVRHDFTQTKTLINAFTHFGAVVQTTGLTKMQIVQEFFGRLATLLQLPLFLSCGIFFLAVLYLFFRWKTKKVTFSESEIRLILTLISMAVGVLALYLSAKNPIWSYHFIGVEIIFLLGIGILLQKSKGLQVIVAIWIVYLLVLFGITSFKDFSGDPKTISGNVIAEEQVVKKINSDANGKDYTVFVYSPSIYSYEYPYLFRYLYKKEVPTRPELNPTDSKTVYLIFPPQVKQSIHDDFIHYRSSDNQYKTIQQWTMSSGSTIIKREKVYPVK